MMGIITAGLGTALGPLAAIYAINAIGLNVQFGYTGLLNFGQVAFMLVGGYGLAISVAVFGVPFWGGVAIGLLASVALALLLGFPTLRLRADYLAIATIAAGEILRLGINTSSLKSFSGAAFGIPSAQTDNVGFADTYYAVGEKFFALFGSRLGGNFFRVGPINTDGRGLWTMIVGWTLALLLATLVWALMRSPWGRVLKAIREDEDAARALGKHTFVFKMQSLILGGVLGGLAGILFVLLPGTVTPNVFMPILTFYTYAIVLVGGAATAYGPLLGSLVFWFLFGMVDNYLRSTPAFADIAGPLVLGLVGLGLMAVIVFRPHGLVGNREEMILDA